MKYPRLFLILSISIFFAISCSQESADIVLTGGKIYTLEEEPICHVSILLQHLQQNHLVEMKEESSLNELPDVFLQSIIQLKKLWN